MIKKQCPYCRDIFDFKAPHHCDLKFFLQPRVVFKQACIKIGGFVFLFAALIVTTVKFF